MCGKALCEGAKRGGAISNRLKLFDLHTHIHTQMLGPIAHSVACSKNSPTSQMFPLAFKLSSNTHMHIYLYTPSGTQRETVKSSQKSKKG